MLSDGLAWIEKQAREPGPFEAERERDIALGLLDDDDKAELASRYLLDLAKHLRRVYVLEQERKARAVAGRTPASVSSGRSTKAARKSEAADRGFSSVKAMDEADAASMRADEAQRIGVSLDEYDSMSAEERLVLKMKASMEEHFWDRFEDLLPLEFALGDGRTVTWGSATISDHEQRIRIQARLAEAAVEDIQLHREAVTLLRDKSAECLDDLKECM